MMAEMVDSKVLVDFWVTLFNWCGASKGVKKTDEKFYVGGEEVRVVEEYKYPGCVLNEHLQSLRMVEERAKTGAGVLGDWLRRCRVTVGEVICGRVWRCLGGKRWMWRP